MRWEASGGAELRTKTRADCAEPRALLRLS
jgi:hypothetical protein